MAVLDVEQHAYDPQGAASTWRKSIAILKITILARGFPLVLEAAGAFCNKTATATPRSSRLQIFEPWLRGSGRRLQLFPS